MQRLRCLALGLLFLLLGAPAYSQGTHEDARYGFKLQPPRGWSRIPLKLDEGWLVAKYLSDKTYVWTDKTNGWSWEHKPELMVIAFVEEIIKKAKEKPTPEEQEKKAEEGEIVIRQDPYEDYEDFLDRTLSGGGFYVSSKEDGQENGVAVTKYEIKIEKLAYTGPKRILAWVYHAPGIDFAVQVELLESSYDKLKSTALSTLRSFRLIPRTGGELPSEAKIDSGIYISISSMNEGSPEERRAKRIESERRIHEKALASLQGDWKHDFGKSCLLLYDADPKYVQRVSEHCDAVLAWLEKNLGFIGPDEYVRKPVLRVCANEAEAASFERGARNSGGWYFGSSNEIVTCKPEDGFIGYELNSVNSSLLELWLRERSQEIAFGLPSWIRHGLSDYVSGARWMKNEMQFRDYLSELMDFKSAVAQGKNLAVRDLVQMTQSEFYGGNQDFSGFWDRWAQSDIFVRFLLSPEAGRNKLTKGLLATYMRELASVVAEVEKETFAADGSAPKAPTTEEEEEELYKKRNQAWQSSEREKAVVQRTFTRVFGGWTDKDWAAVEKAFLKFAD